MTDFVPTRDAALHQLATVDPSAYARSRNYLDGSVTRLSPYLTHGLLSLREVYANVHSRNPLEPQHKFVFELGWRAYYRHVWAHRGSGILQSLHAGPLPEEAYATDMPADVLEARTGIPAIDLAVRTLYDTGYLHNHARMWVASYLVHLRKVHWRAGALWMYAYLLDGDMASNSLSWQWVAGTGSVKPYLFNADNVAKYAPTPWHSHGTVLDTSYEALDAMARTDAAWHLQTPIPALRAFAPPTLHASPLASAGAMATAWQSPDATDALALQGKDVWLHHPWALHAEEVPADSEVVHVGVAFPECHGAAPWSQGRWDFVTQGLRANTLQCWWGTPAQMAHALRHARAVHWHPDPHVDGAIAALTAELRQSQPQIAVQAIERPPLFDNVPEPCSSFAQWWKRAALMP